MADAPQGIMAYPGIKTILRGTFTLSHGISPSVATVSFPATKNFAVQGGPLLISYGNTQILFPDCRLDMASLQADESGQTMTVSIKDRRWRWEFPVISGHYNKLKPNGRIDEETEKTPQELATLLLKAMKESGYDVSQLPNETRPEANWQFDNAAEQLARLCDSLGCRVVLGIDNRVRLCRLGQGVALPSSRVMSGGYGFDPPETPDTIQLATGPTRYQCKFILEAVGLDRDGTVKPLADLSYNPRGEGEPNGWIDQYPEQLQSLRGEDSLSEELRAFALKSVYRWYRIKELAMNPLGLASGNRHLPEYGWVENIKQLLPLSEELLIEQTPKGAILPEAQRAFVQGKFADNITEPKTYINTLPRARYPGNFSIDTVRGIVEFAEPVFQYVRVDADVKLNDRTTVVVKAGGYAYVPAQLYLECTFNVHDEKGGIDRYTLDRKLSNGRFKTEPKVVKREDIWKTVRYEYVSPTVTTRTTTDTTTFDQANQPPEALVLLPGDRGVVTNEDELKKKANYYLDAEQAKLKPKESLSYSYPRIEKINPDGLTHQVSWTVGANGATTEASQNSEFDLVVPTYAERRNLELLKLQKGEITNQLGSIGSVK